MDSQHVPSEQTDDNRARSASLTRASPKRRRARRLRRRLFAFAVAAVLLILATKGSFRSRPPIRPSPATAPAPTETGPPGIVLHASDTPARVHGIPINAARLEAIHKKDHPDWAVTYRGKTYYIGYHYIILPDGRVEPGRPERCPGAHARRFNDWVGVCVVGAFSSVEKHAWWPSTPTPQQVRSVIALCEQLMLRYHIPVENVKRHRDVNVTWCPGGRFPYAQIVQELSRFQALHPEIQPSRQEAAVHSQ